MKHLSSILTTLAVLGTGLTGWAAYKFGRKCEREGVDFHDLNTLKTVAPDLAKPFGVGLATTAAIVGAQTTNMKTIGVISATATGAIAVGRRLEDEVKATVGTAKFNEIKQNVCKKIADNVPFSDRKPPKPAELPKGRHIYILEWDKGTKFEADDIDIVKAELGINRLLHENDQASFADYKDFLRLQPTKSDIACGWDLVSTCKVIADDKDYASWIYFEYIEVTLASGEKAIMICPDKAQMTYLYDVETGLKLN